MCVGVTHKITERIEVLPLPRECELGQGNSAMAPNR